MISFVCRERKHVANTAAVDRFDDARFHDNARDQPNEDIPDQVKHTLPPAFAFRTSWLSSCDPDVGARSGGSRCGGF
jgi:hypothetical protein